MRPSAVAAVLYLVLGFAALCTFAVMMPLGQNPDEPAHALRAAAISEFHFVAHRETQEGRVVVGSLVDKNVLAALRPFSVVSTDPQRRVSRTMWLPPPPWGQGEAFAEYAAPALYPAPFYLPAAAGLLLGRLGHHSVQNSLILARLLTGAASLATGSLALALSGPAVLPLFAVLTLPMTLSQDAAISQDGPLIACAALAGALLARARVTSPAPGLPNGAVQPAAREATCRQTAERGMLLALLAIIAMARPPYLCLSLGLVAARSWPWRWRHGGLLAVLAAFLVHGGFTILTAAANLGAIVGADPTAQLGALLSHPGAIPAIVWNTVQRERLILPNEFVGVLGWLDIVLPHPFYLAARAALAGAVIAAVALSREAGWRAAAILLPILGGAVSSAAGVFFAQYLTWTVPGALLVQGVQGRYCIPIAVFALAAIKLGWRESGPAVAFPALLSLSALAVTGLALSLQAIVLRYYLA